LTAVCLFKTGSLPNELDYGKLSKLLCLDRSVVENITEAIAPYHSFSSRQEIRKRILEALGLKE
jgi:hypothetical protein